MLSCQPSVLLMPPVWFSFGFALQGWIGPRAIEVIPWRFSALKLAFCFPLRLCLLVSVSPPSWVFLSSVSLCLSLFLCLMLQLSPLCNLLLTSDPSAQKTVVFFIPRPILLFCLSHQLLIFAFLTVMSNTVLSFPQSHSFLFCEYLSFTCIARSSRISRFAWPNYIHYCHILCSFSPLKRQWSCLHPTEKQALCPWSVSLKIYSQLLVILLSDRRSLLRNVLGRGRND